MRADFEAPGELHDAAIGWDPVMLALGISRDGLVLTSTKSVSLKPVYVHVKNYGASLAATPACSTVVMLQPKLSLPAGRVSAAKARVYRRLLSMVCLDMVYDMFHTLRRGLLFELAPGRKVLLVPRVVTRNGDYPERKEMMGLMMTASARMPCSQCVVPRAGRNSTLPSEVRVIADICKHTSVAPAGGDAGVKAARAAAEQYGANASGRPPPPFTDSARAISSNVRAHLMSPADLMHTLKMLCRITFEVHMQRAVSRRGVGFGTTLEARRAGLLRFSGYAGRLPIPSENELFRPGSRLPIWCHARSLQLHPALLEGAFDEVNDEEEGGDAAVGRGGPARAGAVQLHFQHVAELLHP